MSTIGLVWDEYTPQIEGQITRDLIALQATFGNVGVYADKNEADTLFSVLGVQRGINPVAWIVYRSCADADVHAPEGAHDVTYRDMYQEVKNTAINPNPENGYFLKPQGRMGRPRLSMLPYPTHNGRTDPAVILLWG